MLRTGVEDTSEGGGEMARSVVDTTASELFFRCTPLMVAMELEEGGRRLGSDMVIFVGLFDIREAIAAERAR